jgi:hypothetical protein
VKVLRPLAFVALAALVGAIVGILVLRARDDETAPARGTGPAIRSVATIAPRVQTFGDPVTASLDLVFDRRVVSPSSVRVDARFDPWRQVGATRRVRTDAGNLVRLRFGYTLSCTTVGCLPSGDKEEVALESAQILYILREARGRAVTTVQWPSFEVVSRVGPFAAQEGARWRADVRSLPPVSYTIAPGVLAALLGGVALLLVAIAAFLVWRLLPRREEEEPVVEVRRVSPVERALDAVALTSSNGAGADQRKALERLARELGTAGQPALSRRARDLAWAPEHPSGGDLDVLERDVRATLAEEAV